METIRLLPEPRLSNYLGMLSRFLALVSDYGPRGNQRGMWLCGDIADVLHNLPPLLIHCDEFDEPRFEDDVVELCSSLIHPWSVVCEEVFRRAAPVREQRVVSPQAPPLLRTARYLNVVEGTLISLRDRWCVPEERLLRKSEWFARWRIPRRSDPARYVEWTDSDAKDARFRGRLASVVAPLIDLIAHWDPVEESRVIAAIRRVYDTASRLHAGEMGVWYLAACLEDSPDKRLQNEPY